jgi:hypothetical protein
MNAFRSKSCREPFCVESGGKWGQTWVQGAQWGVSSPCEWSQHVRGANPMYSVHLEKKEDKCVLPTAALGLTG